MKKNNVLLIGIALVAAALIYYLIENNRKLKFQENRIKELEENKIQLIKDSLSKSALTEEIKNQVLELINEYKDIDEDISNELISVLSLIGIDQIEKAIKDLAKIIENLLKDNFLNDEKFKNKKFVSLGKLIELAKESGLFNNKEYNAVCVLKEFRNEESHELNVKYGSNWQMIGLLGGIEIIFKLKGEKR